MIRNKRCAVTCTTNQQFVPMDERDVQWAGRMWSSGFGSWHIAQNLVVPEWHVMLHINKIKEAAGGQDRELGQEKNY